jgi:hypothetical protein
MPRGSNMPGGSIKTRGNSMPKRAACPGKEQHAQRSSIPRASSMPQGGEACPGEEQHAPGRSSMPRGGAACPGEEQLRGQHGQRE